MKFDNENTLYNFLDDMGIIYREKGNYLDVICPIHNDKDFGNAVFYKNSGNLKCFHGACKFKGDVIDIYEELTGCSKFEAIVHCKELNGEDVESLRDNSHASSNFAYQTRKQRQLLEKKNQVIVEEKQITLSEKTVIKFDPDKYTYTKKRGFTQEFIDHFNIRLATRGKYKDYMLIPIRSKQYNIKTFEARKIKEQELLSSYFEMKGRLDVLRKKFEDLKNSIKLRYEIEDGTPILYKKDERFDSQDKDLLLYFLQSKVLYPYNTLIHKPIIFNVDDLDRTQPLYLTEGLGSIPKIWTNISRNCSSLFGSIMSPAQIEILNEFEHIYLIPDFDKAGVGLVKSFAENITSSWEIIFTEIEDDKPEYIDTISDEENYVGYASYLNYITRHHPDLF
jgi:hypothetical protein